MPVRSILNSPLRQSVGDLPPQEIIFGTSKAMAEVQRRIEKTAVTNIPVLIQGESGTGKDIIARLIHRISPWEKGPYVKITCPAIPASLLESELFGYEKGAFTGAYDSKPGRVELANCGTLFLDEISELDHSLQAKLLQLLQEGQFCRIGANEDTKVDVRIVCATNRDMQQEVAAGNFRQDLFYRINVVNLHLAPLRERIADLPMLIDYFIDVHNSRYGTRAKAPSPEVLATLRGYSWPGNVRELENLVRRYVIFGTDDVFAQAIREQRPNGFGNHDRFLATQVLEGANISLKALTKQAVRDLEREIILKSLRIHHGNRKRTAQALSISYRALLYKIREAGVPSRVRNGHLPEVPAATD